MATYQAKGSLSARAYGLENGQIETTLEKYVLEVLPQDLLKVLRGTAQQELAGQVAINNPPTQILVDGRAVGNRGIDQAMRAVSMRFTDAKLLIAAIEEVYNLLQRITRIQSPPQNAIVARQNFFLWVNGKLAGQLPGALRRLDPNKLDQKTVLRVVGPLVNYGRKLYWSPIGRNAVLQLKQVTNLASGRSRFVYGSKYAPRFRPFSDRTLRRLANRAGPDAAARLSHLRAQRPGTVEGAGQIVRRIMRGNRAFAGLFISDNWVSFPPARSWGKHSKDDRVPSVSVQMGRKGATRLVNILA